MRVSEIQPFVRMLNSHRDKKIVRREPGRDGTTSRMVMRRSIDYKWDEK